MTENLAIQDIWKRIYSEWFPSSGFEQVEGPCNEEREKDSPLVSGYNRCKAILGSGVIVAVLLLFVAGFAGLARHNNCNIFINDDKVEADGIRIDSSGIHGGGISIDSNGVKVPGVSIDSNGVKVPGVSIDDNGVKIDLPDVKINIKNYLLARMAIVFLLNL